jgi:hypothetical protein
VPSAVVGERSWDVVVQIPLHTVSSAEAYVANQEWRYVRLEQCPLHPPGECSFARHGTYPRLVPEATRIARWYCPEGHRTFSLLPDFLAARLPGLLSSIENAVATAQASTSLEVAADELRRDDVTLPCAVRWLRQRVRQVHDGLKTVFGFAAQEPTASLPTLSALRVQLGDDPLLRLRSALPPKVLAKAMVKSPCAAPKKMRRSVRSGMTGPYEPLARLAGVSGAEWSLFCPGMGIALDSWARLMALLDLPAAGSALGATAGVSTEPASGTDGSEAPTVVGTVAFWTGFIIGVEGSGGRLLQALSTSAVTTNAAMCAE